MDRKDKIIDAINSIYESGASVTTKEIIRVVKSKYPEIPESSILPSDFCSNHTNEDPFSGRYLIFEKVSRGLYKVR